MICHIWDNRGELGVRKSKCKLVDEVEAGAKRLVFCWRGVDVWVDVVGLGRFFWT